MSKKDDRQTFVMWVTAKDQKSAKMVKEAMRLIRTGLCDNTYTHEQEYGDDWQGPFAVNDLDLAIFEAFAEEYMGYDKGEDTTEPSVLQGRRIRPKARLIAEEAIAATKLDEERRQERRNDIERRRSESMGFAIRELDAAIPE